MYKYNTQFVKELNIILLTVVVGCTTTYAISLITKGMWSNPAHDELYTIQYYVIKFVSDLLNVGSFLRIHWVPPPKTLTTTI